MSELEKKQRLAELQEKLAHAYHAQDQLTNRYEDGICAELFDAADQELLKHLTKSVAKICEDLRNESDALFEELQGKY
jgi:predicted transcriptional regulator